MRLKKLLCIITAVSVIITSFILTLSVFADNISYTYDESTSTLYINGSGSMDNYTADEPAPWHSYAYKTVNVVIDSEITSIGDYAFSKFSRLESVEIPNGVTSVGYAAFYDTIKLMNVYFPESVTSISDQSFAYEGSALKENFVLSTDSGSYALYYAIKNSINFDCQSIKCGATQVRIPVKQMRAYFPYEARVDGSFRIYSSGSQDTYGRIYDSAFNLLAENDDNESNTNFSVTLDLVKGQTYYIETNLVSAGLTGRYNLRLLPLSYTASGTVNAMKNPYGEASDILVDGAVCDGEITDGNFTFTAQTVNVTKTFEYNGEVRTVSFNPDSDFVVIFMTCDVNKDGYVNAKDYAILKKQDSAYLPLYENFINYHN